jgi:hypothetical protein
MFGMQNWHFVSIRKLEVVEMGRVIRIFNRGVSIRRAVASDEWRVANRFAMKNRRIFAIRKMETIEKAAVIGFLIPDLRLEIVLDGGRGKSGAVPLCPVELSKLHTTHGNIVVTSCQILMSAVILRLPGSRLRFSGVEKSRG